MQTIKKHFVLFLISFLVFITIPLNSLQATSGINKQLPYQGVLQDSAGANVSDGNYDMVFRIYDASTAGATLWTGTHTTANGNVVSLSSGLFRVLLGSGTGNAMTLDFNSDTYWLGVTVGADSEMTPRQRIGAAGYAFNADTLDGTGFATTTFSTGDVLYYNGSAFQRLGIGNNGQILKLNSGIPSWGADLQGSGGSTLFATTTDGLAIHSTDTSDVLILGGNATTTTGNILEVVGNSLFGGSGIFTGLLTAYNTITAPIFTATSTTVASTFPYASTTQLSVSGPSWFTGLATLGNASTTQLTNSGQSWFTGLTTLGNASTTLLTVTGNSYLGTVATGTWNGDAVGVTYGGTGLSSYVIGDIIYANGANSLARLATSTAGSILQLDFSTGLPSYVATSTLGIALSNTTGTLAISRGGTGSTTPTNFLFGDGAGNLTSTSTIAQNYIDSALARTANVLTLTNWFATTTAPQLQTLLGLTNASTTQLSVSGPSWFTGLATLGNASTTQLTNSGQSWFTGLTNLTNATSSQFTNTGLSWFNATSTFASDARFDTNTLVVDSFNNRVGIGTTTPSALLTVAGPGNILQISGGAPTLQGGVATAANTTNGIFVSGEYAYVVSNTTGDDLEIFDISNPTAPVKLGGANTSANALNVYVSGKYAYVVSASTGDDLEIFDISNPTAPVKVGGVGAAANANDVVVVGGYAYVVSNSGGDDLEIFDVTDPTNPVKVGGVGAATTVNAIYISGKYAYLVSNGTGDDLEIFDISNPTAPVKVGGVGASSQANGIYLSGIYAYVVTNNNGITDDLEIFNVSNPALPTKVGGIDLGNSARDVSVFGKYAYVTSDNGGALDDFEIIDVSNPSSPVKVGGIDVGNNIYDVSISGKYAYILRAGANEFEIYDISGIDAPTANIGNIATNYLSVSEDARVDGQFTVGSGLSVGERGIMTDGALKIISTTTASFFGGNVGIGTTSPSYTLDVSGDINQSGASKLYQNSLPVLAASSTTYSVSVGANAGLNLNNGGTYNTFLGHMAGYTATSSDNNTGIGFRALYANTTGYNNTAIGQQSLVSNTTGYDNTAIGNISLSANTTGFKNVAIGSGTLSSNISGYSNLAVGYDSLRNNTAGYQNIAIGDQTLYSNTTANNSVAIGKAALYNNTIGTNNIAVGYNASYLNSTGNDNTALGSNALFLGTGRSNTGVGSGTLYSNGTGEYNTAIGTSANRWNSSATSTVVIGYQAGYGVNGQTYNQNGVLLGYRAGYGLTTGDNNILLGYQAGDNLTTGDSNIIIGYDIDATSTAMTNGLNIGNLIFGTGVDGTGTTLSSGNIGIGTTSPSTKLHIQGAITLASTTPQTTSNALYNNGGTLWWNGSELASSVTQTAEYLFATLSADQTTTAVGGRAEFNTVSKSSGSSISLDTTTNVGRFTLAAGKTYKLTFNGRLSGVAAGDSINGNWYDITAGANLAANTSLVPQTWAINDAGAQSGQVAIITPTIQTEVEWRIVSVSATADLAASSQALIETIADGTQVAQFTGATASTAGTTGFILAPEMGDQGSLLLGSGAWSATSTLFVDTANNRFGIGTTSPSDILNVYSSANDGGITISGANTGVSPTFKFTDASGAIYSRIGIAGGAGELTAGSAENALVIRAEIQPILFTANGGASDQLTINTNGNIGIGTTASTSKLNIETNTLYSGNEGAAHGINIATGQMSSDYNLYMGADKTNGLSYIQSVGNALFKPLVLQGRGGNVGIGTTSPLGPLHVRGENAPTIVGGDGIVMGSEGAGGSGNSFISLTANAGTPYIDFVNDYTSDSDARIILNSDNELQISGADLRVVGTSVTCNIGTGTGATNCTSDERLKTNVSTLGNALDKVLALNPVSFTWKSASSDQSENMGFIAQEVSALFPNVVGNLGDTTITNADGSTTIISDTLGLSYDGLVVPAIKAIQEQQGMLSPLYTGITIDPTLASTTSFMNVDENGNVGIGTTTPQHKLQVNGDVAATGFVNVSTEKAKENIEYKSDNDYKGMLESIKATNIASYEYINDENNEARLGLIAENAPETILSQDGKGVDLYKMTSLVFGAVKAQQAQIEILQNQLNSLTLSGTVDEFITDQENGGTLSVNRVIAKEELCIGESGSEVCLNKEELTELKTLLSGDSYSSGVDSNNANNISPTITVQGNNPAQIEIGSIYSDLGVIAQDWQGNDLSIQLQLNGVDVQSINIDTSTSATYTIKYKVTDTDGLSAEAERAVIVGSGESAPQEEDQGGQDVVDNIDDTSKEDNQTNGNVGVDNTGEATVGGTNSSDNIVGSDESVTDSSENIVDTSESEVLTDKSVLGGDEGAKTNKQIDKQTDIPTSDNVEASKKEASKELNLENKEILDNAEVKVVE